MCMCIHAFFMSKSFKNSTWVFPANTQRRVHSSEFLTKLIMGIRYNQNLIVLFIYRVYRSSCPSRQAAPHSDDQYGGLLQVGAAMMPVVQLEKLVVKVPSHRKMANVLEYTSSKKVIAYFH